VAVAVVDSELLMVNREGLITPIRRWADEMADCDKKIKTAQSARRPCYFWLDPKVTKRSSQHQGFFPTGTCAANPVKPGLQIFCAGYCTIQRFGKSLLCPATRGLTLFYRISPEAALLTGKLSDFEFAVRYKFKCRKLQKR
jgi:hypothetical protein